MFNYFMDLFTNIISDLSFHNFDIIGIIIIFAIIALIENFIIQKIIKRIDKKNAMIFEREDETENEEIDIKGKKIKI
jgi:hypothetical protein